MIKSRELFANLKISLLTLKKISIFGLVLKIACSFIIPLISVFLTYIVKCVLDGIVYRNSGNSIIVIYIVVYFFIKVIELTLDGLVEYSEQIENLRLRKYVEKEIISKCTVLDIKQFDNAELYDELQYVQCNYTSISSLMWKCIEIFSSFLAFFTIFSVTIKDMYVYIPFVVVSCIPAGIARIKFSNEMYNISVEQLADERKLDYLTYLAYQKDFSSEVRVYSLKKVLLSKYNNVYAKLLLRKDRALKKNCLISIILLGLPEVIFCIIMLDILKKIILGEMTVGDFSLYLGILGQVWGNIMKIIYNINAINEDNYNVNFYRKFLKREPEIQKGEIVINEIQCIEFQNVYFKYPYSDDYVLENFSFRIDKGEKIAIVGENGAGKSTIIKLLLRFYDVEKGIILVNGYDIRNLVYDNLRNLVGLYFQNSNNYAFPLYENVIISDTENKEHKKFNKAVQLSGMYDVVRNKKLHFTSYISKQFDQDGIELSGGVHQKFALCRTLYRDSDWFIFDEPSAALDPKAEHMFFEKIRAVSKDKTIIYISHRMSNILLTDRIVVVEKGHVLEDGTFEELMKNKSKFYDLYNYQKGLLH